jgi:hypothetical protein
MKKMGSLLLGVAVDGCEDADEFVVCVWMLDKRANEVNRLLDLWDDSKSGGQGWLSKQSGKVCGAMHNESGTFSPSSRIVTNGWVGRTDGRLGETVPAISLSSRCGWADARRAARRHRCPPVRHGLGFP